MSKISSLFNKLTRKLGDSLQDKDTAKSGSAEENREQSVKTHESSQQAKSAPQESPKEKTEPANPEPPKEKTGSANPEPSKEKTGSANPESPKEKPKTLDDKESLIRNVVSTLSKGTEFRNAMNGKKLVLWLECDKLTFSAYDTDPYRQQMLSTLFNEKGFGFEQVAFSIGKPASELRATQIGDNELEYLQVVEFDPDPVPIPTFSKAEISIYGEAGSLVEDNYILSYEDMKKKRINCYNIGAGKFPKLPTGYRENHIAIDDNPNSKMVEKNKYVSRMHAHIGFSKRFGFYLQVEMDGTRLMGKRTRIFRGEQIIDCNNPGVKIPLQDGDLIELGKAVVLRYIQLNEE